MVPCAAYCGLTDLLTLPTRYWNLIMAKPNTTLHESGFPARSFQPIGVLAWSLLMGYVFHIYTLSNEGKPLFIPSLFSVARY